MKNKNGMLQLGSQNLDDDAQQAQLNQILDSKNRSSIDDQEGFGQFSPNFGQGPRTTGKKKNFDTFNEALRSSGGGEKPLTAGAGPSLTR